jgi:DNA-binding transcriptional LysR family regulator
MTTRRRPPDPLAELLAAADAELLAASGPTLADLLARPWVRYACGCGSIRETLAAAEDAAAPVPCQHCGAPVHAERLPDFNAIITENEAFLDAVIAGLPPRGKD